MHVSLITWVALGTGAACFGVGLAMGLLVVWRSYRNVENVLAGLFNFTVILWGCNVFMIYLIGTTTGEVPKAFRLAAPVPAALNSLVFFALATRAAGAWQARWARPALLCTALLAVAMLWVALSDRCFTYYVFASGSIAYELSPGSRPLGLVIALLVPLATGVLYRRRSARTQWLILAGLIGTGGLASRFIPGLVRYPIGLVCGTLMSLLVAYSIIKEQLFDPLAEKNRLLSAMTDELRAGEAKLTALISNTNDLIWSVDREMRLVTTNATFAELYGSMYRAPLRPGAALLEALPAQEAGDWRAQYERALSGEVTTFERAFADGEATLVLDVALSPIRSASDEITGVACFAHDITERKQAEEAMASAKLAAESANRAKSTFLATMSHELRTPLNAILGYGEMLAEDAAHAGRTEDAADLEKIKGAGKHLLEIISSILDLSKIEAERFELRVGEFEVAPLVLEAAAAVKPAAEKKNNTLRVDVASDVGAMRGDATRVRQVLLNLLSNAAKFTSDGEISIEARGEGGEDGGEERLCFVVRDTGIGMSREEQERLFEPFVQANADIAQAYGGTGLGLAVSQRLCQLMGGEIRLESAPGKGSTFTVLLPRGSALRKPIGPS